jgi:hypothetical protein
MNIIKFIKKFFQYSPLKEGGYQPRPDAVPLEKPKGGSSMQPRSEHGIQYLETPDVMPPRPTAPQEQTQDQMESRLNMKTGCSRCNHGRDYCWCPLKLR